MIKDFFLKLKELPHLRLLIILFTVWQYFSVAGMAVLNWPNSLVWLNLGLLIAFIVLCPVYESLLLLILSIPFYVVIPNSRFDSLSMWRVLYLALFAVWLVRDKKLFSRQFIRRNLGEGGSFSLACGESHFAVSESLLSFLSL